MSNTPDPLWAEFDNLPPATLLEAIDQPRATPSSRYADTDEWGACPECGGNDGYTNVGRVQWFYCAQHKVKWCAGWNLFSSWQHETEEDQRTAWDALDFGTFTAIATRDAYRPGRPAF